MPGCGSEGVWVGILLVRPCLGGKRREGEQASCVVCGEGVAAMAGGAGEEGHGAGGQHATTMPP